MVILVIMSCHDLQAHSHHGEDWERERVKLARNRSLVPEKLASLTSAGGSRHPLWEWISGGRKYTVIELVLGTSHGDKNCILLSYEFFTSILIGKY